MPERQNSNKESIIHRILEFIAVFTDENGYTPSYRDIGAAVGLSSSSSVYWYIKQLKDEGKLITVNRKAEFLRWLVQASSAGPERVHSVFTWNSLTTALSLLIVALCGMKMVCYLYRFQVLWTRAS